MKFFKITHSDYTPSADSMTAEKAIEIYKKKPQARGYKCTAEEVTAKEFRLQCSSDFDDMVKSGHITFAVFLEAYDKDRSNVYDLLHQDFANDWELPLADTIVEFVTEATNRFDKNRASTIMFKLRGDSHMYAISLTNE